ncbi:MAG: hypothetical protein QF561_00955 [Phycisphaerales bacterium]|jgi:hypothetical protein|nr:hypothetical protein [Phycisphaerales bacterium]
MNSIPPNEKTHGIELPQPTAGPMICAFGFTLMAAGIVTNWIVAVVGLTALLAGAVDWFRNANPDSLEMVAPPAREKPTPIVPRPGSVDHLLGDSSHRARIPMEIHRYRDGMIGGAIGGVVMAIFASLWGLIAHGSLWYAVNLLAGTLRSGVADLSMEELAAFSTEGLIVGIIIQAVMAITVGLLYGVVLPLVPRAPLVFAAIIVPLMWSGLTWAAVSVVNPALGDHVEWIWFIASQVVYGVTTGWWIIRSEKIGTMQNWHYVDRIGLETQRTGGNS